MKRFDLSKEIRALQYAMLAFTTYFAFRAEPVKGSLIFTYALWALSCWMVFLKTYRIEISENSTIHFKTLLRTVTVNTQDIVSITDHLNLDIIRYRGGSRVLDPFIENLGELKSTLKTLNSEIELKESSFIASRNTLRVFCGVSLVLLLYLVGLYLVITHFMGKG